MGFVVPAKPEKCMGCRACEMICSLTNSGICSTELSHIKVNFNMFTAAVDIQITDCTGCKACLSYCPEAVLRFQKEEA